MRFMATRMTAALVCAVGASGIAHAGDNWRVVDSAGAVRFGGAGLMPVALTRDQELPKDAWIETSEGSRAVLARGQETIIVEPNSRVQLPGLEVHGNTQVLQTLGSAIYKVGKQQKPHFQVDTPYLAAVVKGTAFTVSVADGQAAVAVTEGLVEVSTPDQSDVEFVHPGFTAEVSSEHRSSITIEQTPSKGEPGAPEPSGEKGGKGVVINAPLGTAEVDVKDATGGLAMNDVTPGDVAKSVGGVIEQDNTGSVTNSDDALSGGSTAVKGVSEVTPEPAEAVVDHPEPLPPTEEPAFTPPGQDPAFVPPGQVPGGIPPGQDPSFVPPGQAKQGKL